MKWLKPKFGLTILILTIVIFNTNVIYAQNVAVTDKDAYAPDQTAMLDVMSTDKGVLVPRMTTLERLAIGNPPIGEPATGLLVYDTDFNNFFYYNGVTWMGLPQLDLDVSGVEGPLFHVTNLYGDTIFAVYNDGVEIIIPTGVKGKIGGFAVSGRPPSKATDPDNFMVITPDSARIYINDTINAKGKVGGFAVSGRTPSKGISTDIIFATVDSTRIYVDETQTKGKVGGFAVSGRTPSKSSTSSFLNLSSKNYFIGRNSGVKNTTGEYNFFAGDSSGYNNVTGSKNIFLGYSSGYSNVGEGGEYGNHNIFIGYKAGFKNQIGFNNIFLGYRSGYNTLGGTGFEQGSFNTFIGYESGFKSQIAGSNTFLGFQAGYENIDGNHNTYLGRWAGKENTGGSYNVFIGTEAGRQEMGSHRLCINAINYAGYAPPLIYGEFDNRNIVIDGDANDNPGGEFKLAITGRVGAVEFANLGKKSELKSKASIENSLDKISQLSTISYTSIDTKGNKVTQIGIDPETAVKIIPEIAKDYGDIYGVEYGKLTVLLIEAIKEQQKQIEELQKSIQIKDIELQKTSVNEEQINLLIEENTKLKQDIEYIKTLLEKE